MKKGLLLSVVASTMIFAGGDIAPVEPAAPASADFWGQIGVRYQAQDFDNANLDFGDEENNAFGVTAVLGVEKQLGNGFGFGVEVAGWSDFGFDIADGSVTFSNNPLVAGSTDQTAAEISQAYLTYTFGNTAIKAGRQALPKAVSPWAWSDRSAGVIDMAYDGIVIANTDLADTTLVGAWIKHVSLNSEFERSVGDSGLFAIALINKSLANTTLSLTGYYVPDNELFLPYLVDHDVLGLNVNAEDMWSIWGSAVTNFDGITAGLQVAYVDGDYSGVDSTFGVAGKIGSSWGDFNAEFVAAYINDGQYSLRGAGSTVGTSAFWGNSLGGFLGGGDTVGVANQTILRLIAGYKIGIGKLYGEIAYDNYSSGYGDAWGARIGYKFNVMGVDANIEYRYADYSDDAASHAGDTRQRIRVEAYYKF